MLIVLSGRKGSGKDTVGEYLVQKGFIRYAFADALKDICKILYSLSNEQLNGHLKEVVDQRYNKTPRELLQFTGTLLRNNIHIDIWANIVKNKLLATRNANVVITDLRFQNELDIINCFGGFIINIERPALLENHFNLHESEQQILPYNLKIVNNGTIIELWQQIDLFLNSFNNSYFF
jgi:dephospho-CoA kinase